MLSTSSMMGQGKLGEKKDPEMLKPVPAQQGKGILNIGGVNMVKKVRMAWLWKDHPYLHVVYAHALKYLTAQPRVHVKLRT